MLTIYLLRPIQVNAAPHEAGDVITTDEADALYCVRSGSARIATDEDIRNARNPQPAAEIRKRLEAQAIKGGPRPQRHG